MKRLLPLLFVILSFSACAGQADIILIHSPAMKKDIKCVVIRPTRPGHPATDRGTSSDSFPVIYLLHGHSGSYAQWPATAPQLKQEADEFGILFVCPDGGYGSWWFDSPVDPSIRYETFVTKELVPYIDSHYPTMADRQHRAITGLSMGGHGGLYLGIRHQDLFGAAGATSGGGAFRPLPQHWDLKKDVGDPAGPPANCGHNKGTPARERLQKRAPQINLLFRI